MHLAKTQLSLSEVGVPLSRNEDLLNYPDFNTSYSMD